MAASPYLTPTEVRSRVARIIDLTDSEYPDAEVARVVAEFEEQLEPYRGVAYTPRTQVDEVRATARTEDLLILTWPLATAITSIVVNGATVASTRYSLRADGSSIVDFTGGLVPGYPATVTYTHGHTAPPETVKRACALYVVRVLQQETAGTSRDVLWQNFDGGSTRYSTPNIDEGRLTGFLEVDRLVNGLPDYRQPTVG